MSINLVKSIKALSKAILQSYFMIGSILFALEHSPESGTKIKEGKRTS